VLTLGTLKHAKWMVPVTQNAGEALEAPSRDYLSQRAIVYNLFNFQKVARAMG
jgi:hypothetical protein